MNCTLPVIILALAIPTACGSGDGYILGSTEHEQSETLSHSIFDAGADAGTTLACAELTPCDRHITLSSANTVAKCPGTLLAPGAHPAHFRGAVICLHAADDPEQSRAPVRIWMLSARLDGPNECDPMYDEWWRFSAEELPDPEKYRPRMCGGLAD
jgi:hypothetical protein